MVSTSFVFAIVLFGVSRWNCIPILFQLHSAQDRPGPLAIAHVHIPDMTCQLNGELYRAFRQTSLITGFLTIAVNSVQWFNSMGSPLFMEACLRVTFTIRLSEAVVLRA